MVISLFKMYQKPKIKSNHLIIKTNASLISIGTEKTLLFSGDQII